MSQTIRSVHSAYAVRLNHQLGESSGHAWQGRYYSVPAVRAGIVRQAEKFPWSTGQHHLRPAAKPVSLRIAAWIECWNPAQWSEALATGISGEEEFQIWRPTKLGSWRESTTKC